jgi:hypothetical protein
VESTLGDVPFAAFDTFSDPPRRLKIAFVEDANNGVPNLLWDMGWDGDSVAFVPANGGREYTFILADDYDTDYTDYLNGTLDPQYNYGMYAFWPGARGTHPYLEANFELQIFGSRVNGPNDTFTFTSPAAMASTLAAAKADLDKINVYPNPYLGGHAGESTQYDTWVRFTNLPPTCTIRIFNLVGDLVKKIDRENGQTTFENWDLLNTAKLPVASGIYLYHIDIPDVGEKTGKLAILSAEQRLNTF